MGIFKKKAECVETSEETQKLLDRIKVLEEWIRQKQSDVNLGWISAEQYFEDIAGFKKELAVIEYLIRGEVNENSRIFDNQMGKPIQWLDEIFNTDFDDRVHNEIERVINECAKQTETD